MRRVECETPIGYSSFEALTKKRKTEELLRVGCCEAEAWTKLVSHSSKELFTKNGTCRCIRVNASIRDKRIVSGIGNGIGCGARRRTTRHCRPKRSAHDRAPAKVRIESHRGIVARCGSKRQFICAATIANCQAMRNRRRPDRQSLPVAHVGHCGDYMSETTNEEGRAGAAQRVQRVNTRGARRPPTRLRAL
jgi:hypothetical protein